jgi:hypothetical protein
MTVEREAEKAEATVHCIWFDGVEAKPGEFLRRTWGKVRA